MMDDAFDREETPWFIVGSRPYGLAQVAPLAYAHMEKFGRPLPLRGPMPAGSDSMKALFRPLSSLRPWHNDEVSLCLDIPSLLLAKGLGRKTLYVHHSLIGKGKLFRDGKPHWAMRFADGMIFPDAGHKASFPASWHARIRTIEPLPLQWCRMPATLLSPDAEARLRAWRDAPRPRVLLLSTHGKLSAMPLFRSILDAPPAGISFGMKAHPKSGPVATRKGHYRLDGVPVPLLAACADLVVGDHSSATLEADRLGIPILVAETPALHRLMAIRPPLRELAYLAERRRFSMPDELRAALDVLGASPPEPPAPRPVTATAAFETLDRIASLVTRVQGVRDRRFGEA